MSRFNTPMRAKTRTENLAGGEAYQESPELHLVSILLTSFIKDQFYRFADETYSELVDLIVNHAIDPKFVAKAAIFARNEFGMRTVSHVVAATLAAEVKGKTWTKHAYEKMVRRPDDILEILSFYLSAWGKPIPNSLKKGLAASFQKFDEYQLSKYKKEKAAMSLVDAVNLLHPKGNPGIDALMSGALKPAETWETKLTQAGQQAEDVEDKDSLKREAWRELVISRKIGYFALLRNLRNIVETKDSELIKAAADMLVQENLIRKSLVLPFRFATAHDEVTRGTSVSAARDIIIALNKAIDISCKNVPELLGDTLVVLDVSGSMGGRPAQIGSLFAAILCKANNADLMLFSNHAEYRQYNPMDSVLTIANNIRFAAGGTNFQAIFETANRKYDRIVILSDMQGWMGYYSPSTTTYPTWKKRFNADPFIYSFDLTGYGTLQFPERSIYCLAGFSEKVFDIMKLLEEDKQAMINKIKAVEL